jgi:hypothetical protein
MEGAEPSEWACEMNCTTTFLFMRAPRRFWVARIVGPAGSLRPIVNRPNAANVQHSSFAAWRYAGQDAVLRAGWQPLATHQLLALCAQPARPIDNRPQATSLPHDAGDPKIVPAREEIKMQ